MKLIERNYDVLTGENDLELLHRFERFPVFMGCVDDEPEDDLFAQMSWHISRSSGLIQLNPVLPLDIIYRASHGAGSTGKLWDRHHWAFAQFIHTWGPRSILEIGGAHGILAKRYCSLQDARWTIVEPNPMLVEGVPARIIKGFFDDRFTYNEPFDALVHSHVLEHVYEPERFMRLLSRFMGQGRYLIFSVPNMEVMLARKYTNCINFEHTVFLTEAYIEHLLSQYGFRLIRKEYFQDDHSIFYAALSTGSCSQSELPAGLFAKNRENFQSFIRYYQVLIDRLNQMLLSTKEAVYLFGAHVFSQYLIAFGLDTRKIHCLLDNDPKKQGKRLYGTPLKVAAPKVLAGVSDPLVILKAGVYNEEIRQDILSHINPRTRFLE
jgi:Methyltransferase domain